MAKEKKTKGGCEGSVRVLNLSVSQKKQTATLFHNGVLYTHTAERYKRMVRNWFRRLAVGWMGKEGYSAVYEELCDHSPMFAQDLPGMIIVVSTFTCKNTSLLMAREIK